MADEKDDEPVDIETIFETAAEYVREHKAGFTREGRLILYGKYKQATEGKCNITRPGFFSFCARSKWDAWNSMGDIEQLHAKVQYISFLCVANPNWLLEVEDAKYRAQMAEEKARLAQTSQGLDENKANEKT